MLRSWSQGTATALLLPPHIIDLVLDVDGPLEWPQCEFISSLIASFHVKNNKNGRTRVFGSTTTLFAATDTAAATVLPPPRFEYLNEEAAALVRRKGECNWLICTNSDRRQVPHLHNPLAFVYEEK